MTQFQFSYEVYPKADLFADFQKLIDAAEKATDNAYAPYSNFLVGAAILLEGDIVVTGSNQENAAYPSGICAERTAIYYAGAQYPNLPIKAITFAAKRRRDGIFLAVAPCGACRQAILEYESKQENPIIQVIPRGDNNFALIPSIAALLPFSFDKASL